jgi:hypothetical protein
VQPGITVDEEARRRQDEHVRAASGGHVFRSSETPVRMSQRNTTRRESPHIGATPLGTVSAGLKRSASVASIGNIDDHGTQPDDSSMKDAPSDRDQPAQPPDNQETPQDTTSAPLMQPPAAISQQSHPIQVTHPPSTRPNYQVATAFDRVMRDKAKGEVIFDVLSLQTLTVV